MNSETQKCSEHVDADLLDTSGHFLCVRSLVWKVLRMFGLEKQSDSLLFLRRGILGSSYTLL
jgi:hypothetical protein